MRKTASQIADGVIQKIAQETPAQAATRSAYQSATGGKRPALPAAPAFGKRQEGKQLGNLAGYQGGRVPATRPKTSSEIAAGIISKLSQGPMGANPGQMRAQAAAMQQQQQQRRATGVQKTIGGINPTGGGAGVVPRPAPPVPAPAAQ